MAKNGLEFVILFFIFCFSASQGIILVIILMGHEHLPNWLRETKLLCNCDFHFRRVGGEPMVNSMKFLIREHSIFQHTNANNMEDFSLLLLKS